MARGQGILEAIYSIIVMAGLDPAIHVQWRRDCLGLAETQQILRAAALGDLDPRDKPGDDEEDRMINI